MPANPRPPHTRSTRRLARLAPLALGIALGLGMPAAARPESLLALYPAARGHDASHLPATAQADAPHYAAAPPAPLARPSANPGATSGRVRPSRRRGA